MSAVKESALLALTLLVASTRVSSALYSESWSSTQAEELTHNHTWILNNLDKLFTLEYIDSPVFSSSKSEKFKWFIRLFPHDPNERSCIKLRLFHTHSSTVDVNYALSIGSVEKESEETFQGEDFWSFAECFMKRSEFFQHIQPNGDLVINCVIRLRTPLLVTNSGSKRVIEPSISINNQSHTTKIPENFENLLENEMFSDITVVIEGKEIRAHRNILAVQSPVFASLLVKNANSSSVEIKDVKLEVFRKLLRYVYTNEVDGIDNKMAKDLLVAAIKYDIKGLKAICGEILCSNMNGVNAVEVLVTADQHNMPELKLCASKFIAEHV